MSTTATTCNMNTFLPLIMMLWSCKCKCTSVVGDFRTHAIICTDIIMTIIRAEIMLCRRQYFHQVCENLADGNHVEEQKQVQTTVVFALLNLISKFVKKIMPKFLIYNDTISQTGSKMEQCNSLLPRHSCPFCCHFPGFMVLENCLPFNQYL